MQPASQYVAAVQTVFIQVKRSVSDADQSCCECGAQRIQMIPLQREVCLLHFAALPVPEILQKLDPPMSNWFCSVPHAMDTISYSIKARQSIFRCCLMTEVYQFQQDMLISLIRYLREKAAQQRDVLLRNKQEIEELKRLRKYVMLSHRVGYI